MEGDDDNDQPAPRRTVTKCKGCGNPIRTWAQQQRQFWRAVNYGLTPEEAKQVMPRCQKCTTDLLSPHGQQQRSRVLQSSPDG